MQKNMTSKKGLALRIGALAATALCAAAIGVGTFAKYTTSIGAEDNARVALFNFTDANGNSKIQTNVDLFKTSYDSTVEASDGSKVLAPGTANGDFDIVIKGNAEVDINITLDINQSITDLPIVYAVNTDEEGVKYYSSLGSGTYSVKGNDLDGNITVDGDLDEMSTALNYKYEANDTDFSKTYNVKWYWAYENTGDGTQLDKYDVADTSFGQLAENVKLTVAATATQID